MSSASNDLDPRDLELLIDAQAQANGIPHDLLASVIQQESGGNPSALGQPLEKLGGVRAQGLMQLLPATAQEFGVKDPFNAEQNVTAGAKKLAGLIKHYDGNIDYALAAYNGGDRAVDALKAGKPWTETAGYIKGVRSRYQDAPIPPRGKDIDLDADPRDTELAQQVDPRDAELAAFQKQDTSPSLWDRVKQAATETGGGVVLDTLKGLGEGGLETALNLVKGARTAYPGGLAANIPDKAIAKAEELATPVNTTQKVGRGIEQAAEFAVPGMAADELVLKGASKVLPKVIGNPVLRVMANGAELAARGAGQAPVGAGIAAMRGEDPVKGAEGAAIAGSLGAGVVEGAAPALDALAMGATKAALKTPVTILRNSSSALGHSMAEKLDAVARTVLNHKLGSPEAAEAFIHDLEHQLDKPIDAATALGVVTDAPQRAQQYLRNAKQNLTGVVSDPGERVGAFETQADRLLNVPGGSHAEDALQFTQSTQPSTILAPGAGSTAQAQANSAQAAMHNPIQLPVVTRQLRTDMTPRETLNSARGADTKWDPSVSNATNQARKVTEIAERDALKAAVPEVAPILDKQAHAIVAKNALQREAVRHGNMDLISLGMAAGHGNPIAMGHQVLRMSGVKGGILMDQLAKFLQKGDEQGVISVLTKMGYGAALDSIAKNKAQ